MVRIVPRWICVVWLLLTMSVMTSGLSPASAQIFTRNAGITSPETPVLRESLLYYDAEHLQSLRLDHQILWGLTTTFEVDLTLPTILYQRVRFDGIGGRQRDTVDGLGDLAVTLKKRLYQSDGVLASTRWAVVGRLQVPTGDDDQTDDGVRLPRLLQASTGSWEPGLGTIATIIRDRHRLSVETLYAHPTRHEGFRPGPAIHANVAYWYRLHPPHFSAQQRVVEVRPVLELLTRYRFASRGSSGGLPGDAGWQVALAPGVQIYPRDNLLFEFGVQLPLADTADDDVGELHSLVQLSVKFLF